MLRMVYLQHHNRICYMYVWVLLKLLDISLYVGPSQIECAIWQAAL